MLLIEKYVTFKEATERTVKAKGDNIHVYPGMRLNLDLGQFVPEVLGGDILVEALDNDSFKLKPLGNAKLYVLTKAIPDVVPKKAAKLVAARLSRCVISTANTSSTTTAGAWQAEAGSQRIG